jgi:hypothetical protein
VTNRPHGSRAAEKRPLSQTPSAIAARERRLTAAINKFDAEWHAEIGAKMKAENMTYDEAFVACGGTILPLCLWRLFPLKPDEES